MGRFQQKATINAPTSCPQSTNENGDPRERRRRDGACALHGARACSLRCCDIHGAPARLGPWTVGPRSHARIAARRLTTDRRPLAPPTTAADERQSADAHWRARVAATEDAAVAHERVPDHGGRVRRGLAVPLRLGADAGVCCQYADANCRLCVEIEMTVDDVCVGVQIAMEVPATIPRFGTVSLKAQALSIRIPHFGTLSL